MVAKTTGADPKAAAGSKKTQLHLIPTSGLESVAKVMELGASKYGAYNWRTGDKKLLSVYLGAIFRHLVEKMNGRDVDPESGKDPLAHVIATALIILDMEKTGQLQDDRPANQPEHQVVTKTLQSVMTEEEEAIAHMDYEGGNSGGLF